MKGGRQRGKLKGRKASQGPRWRKKHQYCVHLEEVSGKERKRQSHGREAGSSAERKERGLKTKRGSINDII